MGFNLVRGLDFYDLKWKDGWVMIKCNNLVRVEGKNYSFIYRNGENVSIFLRI